MNKLLIAAVAVIALVAVGAYLYLSSPAPVAEYSEGTSVELASQNANLVAALYAGGIEDATADVGEDRVYIAYNLPSGFDADITQRYAIGVGAKGAPQSMQISVMQYREGKPAALWTVAAEYFKAFARGELAGEELDAKISKKTF